MDVLIKPRRIQMTERQLGKVLIAGMGLWLLTESIAYVATFLNVWMASSFREYLVRDLSILGITGGCGVILLALREPLARRLFQETTAAFQPEPESMVAALLAVLGVYFAVTAIVALLGFEGQHWLQMRRITKQLHGPLSDIFRPEISVAEACIGEGSKIAIGISLFFGSRGLARVWHGLREAGKERP
jgi:hypothetical protein